MKAVMIMYNQILEREVEEILNRLSLRGFTRWQDVQGRGTEEGEPHMGTHTWPVLNGTILTVVGAEAVPMLLEALRSLDRSAPGRGVRAFVWAIEESV